MQERERRWKIVSVGVDAVLDMFCVNKASVASIPYIDGLPEDAVVDDVCTDCLSRTFLFRISHPSFPIVPNGSAGERLWVSGNHPIRLIRLEKLGEVYDKNGKRIYDPQGEDMPIYVVPK